LGTISSIAAGRRGLTLIEILVACAIMAIVAVIGLPAINGIFDLQQRAAAKEIAQTYTWLMDEAALRNVTFRIAYNLDARSWKVEAGDPGTLVFGTPEEREKFDEQLRDELRRFTQREIEEGQAQDIEAKRGRFEGLTDIAFETGKELPGGTKFAYVYTPQYEDGGLKPSDPLPDDPEDAVIAYTYIFPDGTAEHTVVRVVDEDDPEDGWTIEVWPMSGEIHLSTDVVDPETSLAWIPEEAPELQ